MIETSHALSDPLPGDPMPAVALWLEEAMALGQLPNPNSMTLATVDADGEPAARIVLAKDLVPDPGYVVFYTNYESAKGNQLAQRPVAVAVFHWDSAGRQVRIRGPVVRSPAAESDAYFATRNRTSQLGAWASQQSQPIESRQALMERLEQYSARFPQGTDLPRPPYWGGYRLWAQTVELWLAAPGRLHDRARWTRTLERDGEHGFRAGAWSAVRLQP